MSETTQSDDRLSGTVMATGYSTAADSAQAGATAARRAKEQLGADAVDFCQVFCSASYDFDGVLGGLREHVGSSAEVIGGASHTPFTERGIHSVGKQSVSVALIASDNIRFFTGIGTGVTEDVRGSVREAARDLPRRVDGYPHLTAIVIPDGLAAFGEELTMAVRQRLGTNVSFVGGGAHFEFKDTPVIRNDETAENSVAIALLASTAPPGVSFAHEHEPISQSYEVTKSEGTLVHELDGRPAYEVWGEEIREDAREEFGVDVDDLEDGSEQLTNLLYHYQFGVDQGNHYKLRNPGLDARTDGPLEFTLNIPEGTVMRLMANTEQGYIAAARNSARQALEEVGGQPAGAFVYDCGCRRQMLGDDYIKSVNGITEQLQLPLQGTEVFGEICMRERQVSGYHNTTTVVMVVPK